MVGNPVRSRLNRKIHLSLSPRARVNAAREDVVLRDGLGRPILHCSTSHFEFSNTSEAVFYEDFFFNNYLGWRGPKISSKKIVRCTI